MALPKLNENPEYRMTIPSTGKQVKFRPFLVKEQKVMMIASESQDRKQMLNSMLETINACVSDVESKHLATFDVDYLFTQIRAKSVGENSELQLKCSECEHQNEFVINLSEIKPPKVELDQVIHITPDISLSMQYPTYHQLMGSSLIDDEITTDNMVEFLITCIQSVNTLEESILFKDEPLQEKINFIESLNTEQFNRLSEFLQNMPKLTHKIEVNCAECGHKNVHTLEGMESFF